MAKDKDSIKKTATPAAADKKAKKSKPEPKHLAILDDHWLDPVQDDVMARYERFHRRLKELESYYPLTAQEKKAKLSPLEKLARQDQYLGLNYSKEEKGWWLREWAPAAKEMYVFGDFNGWTRYQYPLSHRDDGIWEIFFDDKTFGKTFVHGSLYKLLVRGADDSMLERLPAYTKRAVQDDTTKIFSAQVWKSDFDWEGDDFKPNPKEPLLIYECHIGMAQEKEGVGTYKEFEDNVLPHVIKGGYNTIQIMAIAEHPYYGSFGYHVSNFFAPSSRFGTPEELKHLIKTAHSHGLRVIMDIVHSHTVKNLAEGINRMDGTDCQYTHPGGRGDHPQWDSKLFDYGKTEVIQFLLSNIRYWMRDFHFDGFRFDGVTSMLYMHHGNVESYNQAMYFRDGVEFDAVTYLQLANYLMKQINAQSVSIAEDVSGMPGLTSPIEAGGMGFDYRLGMGIPDYWIKLLKEVGDDYWNVYQMWHVLNDRLPMVKTVAYAESHDQALVGDKTIAFRLMDKEMYFCMATNIGSDIIDRGISLHKMIRMFTIVNGGQAYMNFMGNEFGHPEWIDFPREGNGWSYKHARRQWSLMEADYLKYHFLNDFDEAMIKLIREYPVMQDLYGQQLNMDEQNHTIVEKKGGLVFVFNFHPTACIADYKFYIPEPGVYKIILNSDDLKYGGFGRLDNDQEFFALPEDDHYKLSIYNVNRTVLVLKKVRD
ncbi:MAG: alpha amylase C-terminal domain-containing protein [Bacteroidales bacterium]|nr:alpha amylase C-terminal domain-containing protein [Bacteroidales bacterium]